MLRAGAGALLVAGSVLVQVLCFVAVCRAQEPAGAGGGQLGTIAGTVLDSATGDPIIEAGVEVVGQGKKVRTDLDGKYTIKIAPGTYELRVFAPLYQGTRLQNVVVRPNQVTKADASLKPQGEAGVEVVEVVAQASKAAETTQLIQRQKADTVEDTIGAQEIASSPDSDAAEVVERMPAVTVVDNQYIYVRGLGERYSNAQLNGSRLPSTDPERRVVALDLFPAPFVESISIIKTYAPNLTGDFSGGLVDIHLRDFPEQFSYSIAANVGANTGVTFQKYDTYKNGGPPFGVDSPQNLPGIFPGNIGQNLPPAQQRFYASALENIWSLESNTAPPNFELGLSFSDSFGPLGIGIAGLYKTEYNLYDTELAQNVTPTSTGTNTDVGQSFKYKHSFFDAKLGGILSVGYKISPEDKIALHSLVNLLNDSEVYNGQGVNALQDSTRELFQTELTYDQQLLGYFQLAGEHRLPSLNDLLFEWRTAGAQSTDDQPDTRFYQYDTNRQDPGTPMFFFNPGQPQRAYQNLQEYLTDSNADVTFPFKTATDLPAKLKAGAEYLFRVRSSNLRTFTYLPINGGPSDLTAPPEVILQPSNIGTTVEFQETTQNTFAFQATQEVIAGYTMLEMPVIAEKARVIAGVRTEYSFIDLEKAFDFNQNPIHPTVLDIDPLPAITAIYEPQSDMRVTGSFGQSVSRPEMHELDPAEFPVAPGERAVRGNPNLITATIQSYDVRWDWFFSPLELASGSFFYKKINNPIEQIALAETSSIVDSFRNSENATVWGFEAEGRKNFGFLAPLMQDRQYLSVAAPYLQNLRMLVNFAWLNSNVNVGRVGTEAQTSTERQLQGASPLVVNASLEFEDQRWGTFRLLYNTVDRYIAATGILGLPDIFQERRDQLDFVWLSKISPFGLPLSTKFAIENILNDPYRQTEGGVIIENYATGVKFTAGLSYTF